MNQRAAPSSISRESYTHSASEGNVRGGWDLVFDKFKSWRNAQNPAIICPACQHPNQEGTSVCTRCYYQIDRSTFEQSSVLGEGESSDLLDQLMSEIEQEEAKEEAIPSSFSMDDVTVEIAQYGDDDQVVMNHEPDFQSILSHTEPMEEEEYELTAADVPTYVTKFEVPNEIEESTSDEPPEQHTVELIQPTAETPEFVELESASEFPDPEGWSRPTSEEPMVDPADFDGDGRVDEFEAAFAHGDSQEQEVEDTHPNSIPKLPVIIPPAPEDIPIPRITAVPLLPTQNSNAAETNVPEIPPAPIGLGQPTEVADPIFTSVPESFWPWHQQDEWAAPEIIKQLQAAIRAAKDQNTAEATVLLDEVGPHLGNRTSLVYSVARLLMSIGRSREATNLVESASKAHPDDQDIAKAREKLSS